MKSVDMARTQTVEMTPAVLSRKITSLHVLVVPQDVAAARSYFDRPDCLVSSSTKLGLGSPPSCRIIPTSIQALS